MKTPKTIMLMVHHKRRNSYLVMIWCNKVNFYMKNNNKCSLVFKISLHNQHYNELTINQTESKKKSYYLPVDTVDNLEIDVIFGIFIQNLFKFLYSKIR